MAAGGGEGVRREEWKRGGGVSGGVSGGREDEGRR